MRQTYLRTPSHSCGGLFPSKANWDQIRLRHLCGVLMLNNILSIAFSGVLQKVFCPYLVMFRYPYTPYLKEKLRLIAKQVLVLDEKLRSENLLRLSPEEALSVCAGVIPFVNKALCIFSLRYLNFLDFRCCLRLQHIKNANLSPSRKKLLLPNETVQTTVYLSITSNSLGSNPFQIISDLLVALNLSRRIRLNVCAAEACHEK